MQIDFITVIIGFSTRRPCYRWSCPHEKKACCLDRAPYETEAQFADCSFRATWIYSFDQHSEIGRYYESSLGLASSFHL